MCECYTVDQPGADPSCDVHGPGGYLDQLQDCHDHIGRLLGVRAELKDQIEILKKDVAHYSEIICNLTEQKED